MPIIITIINFKKMSHVDWLNMDCRYRAGFT